MPQMAPLNWLILTIVFTLTFLVFNIVNYFSLYYEPGTFDSKKKIIKIHWKW